MRHAVVPLLCAGLLGAQEPVGERPYLERALAVERWLSSCRVETEHGVSWPVDPARPERHESNLYSGTAGVVLFYLEAWHATGRQRLLDEATAGADHLIASLPDGAESIDAGLYTGVSGLGFVFLETWRASGEKRFRDAASRCVTLLREHAVEAGAGVEWNDVTDIISGSAGIGLFLLHVAVGMDDDVALDQEQRAHAMTLVGRAAARLEELGEEAEGGTKWAMSPRIPRAYPNFSHGTAGVAYFFAELSRVGAGDAGRDAAVAGGERLLALAQDGLVPHHEPGGEELFYLGWCHGPPGTARLYHVLGELTGDAQWANASRSAFDAAVATGIPAERPDGFWNNAGQCCGTAGMIEWVLATRPEDEDFLRALVDDLDARATRKGDTMFWVHAEHRVRPELLAAQTGYMQGAAGIGLCYLRLDAEGRREPVIVFPDSPYR